MSVRLRYGFFVPVPACSGRRPVSVNAARIQVSHLGGQRFIILTPGPGFSLSGSTQTRDITIFESEVAAVTNKSTNRQMTVSSDRPVVGSNPGRQQEELDRHCCCSTAQQTSLHLFMAFLVSSKKLTLPQRKRNFKAPRPKRDEPWTELNLVLAFQVATSSVPLLYQVSVKGFLS